MADPVAETAAAIALHFGMLPERQHAGPLPKLYQAASRAARVFMKAIEDEVAWGEEADYVQTLHNYAGRILEYMASHSHEIPSDSHLSTLARESIYYFMQPKFAAPLSPAELKMIRDLLTAGLEGGIGYWAQVVDVVYPPGTMREDFREGGKMQPRGDYYHPYELIPTIPGGAIILRDLEESPDPPERVMREIRRRAEKAKRTLKRHFGQEPEGPDPEEEQIHPEEVEGWTTYRLDLPALQRAWTQLQIEYPKIYQDVLDENYDADTGDLFIQLAAIGKQVYG